MSTITVTKLNEIIERAQAAIEQARQAGDEQRVEELQMLVFKTQTDMYLETQEPVPVPVVTTVTVVEPVQSVQSPPAPKPEKKAKRLTRWQQSCANTESKTRSLRELVESAFKAEVWTYDLVHEVFRLFYTEGRELHTAIKSLPNVYKHPTDYEREHVLRHISVDRREQLERSVASLKSSIRQATGDRDGQLKNHLEREQQFLTSVQRMTLDTLINDRVKHYGDIFANEDLRKRSETFNNQSIKVVANLHKWELMNHPVPLDAKRLMDYLVAAMHSQGRFDVTVFNKTLRAQVSDDRNLSCIIRRLEHDGILFVADRSRDGESGPWMQRIVFLNSGTGLPYPQLSYWRRGRA